MGNIKTLLIPFGVNGIFFGEVMFTEITIAKMQDSDKNEYFEMSRDFYSLGVTNSQITDKGRECFWKEILSGEVVKAYILRCGGKTAGYAVCALSASQEAGGRVLWLDELYVKPQFRGKGAAKQFFKFIELSDDYKIVRLEVELNNDKATKLYKSLGYKEVKYLQLYKKTNQSDTEELK
ncbi:MAG: GNAT family N-acetyltransferase [Clostridia bacterium]|nr:GNAT family N-acetyltransferase [Clostridia bacterium]